MFTVKTSEKNYPGAIAEVSDPRPDLSADSYFWTVLLDLSAQHCDPALTESLIVMRQRGTRLKKLDSGDYGLRPQIDSIKGCWPSAEVYKTAAVELLKPHHDQLVELLKEFSVFMKPIEAARIRQVLEQYGVCAIYSEVLKEKIYFARDQQIAARAPKSAVVYTLDELRSLAAGPSPSGSVSQLSMSVACLRQIHAAKKIFGGTIVNGTTIY